MFNPIITVMLNVITLLDIPNYTAHEKRKQYYSLGAGVCSPGMYYPHNASKATKYLHKQMSNNLTDNVCGG